MTAIDTPLRQHRRAYRRACLMALSVAAGFAGLAGALARLDVLGATAAALLSAAGAIGALIGVVLHGVSRADECSAPSPGDQAGQRENDGERIHASRSRDELLSLASHDLRSALNAMVGWLHLARSPKTDPAAMQRALDGIASAVDSQRRVVDQLLDAARLLGGRMGAALRPVSPEALLMRVETRFAARAAARKVELRFEPVPSGLWFDADPLLAEETLAALVEHAIAATPPWGKVRVRAARSGAAADASVMIDVCLGCAEACTPGPDTEVPLVPAPGSDAYLRAATLPIAIARAVTELQGGSLVIAPPAPHSGQTLSLRFQAVPGKGCAEAVPPAPATVPMWRAAAGSDDEDTGYHGTDVLSGCNILFAHGRVEMLEALADVLRGYGAQVTTTESGDEAVGLYPHWARGTGERLLICDPALAGVDGLALIDRIRRLEGERGLPRLPAAAFSAQMNANARRAALKAGFDLLLVQPMSPARLVEAILPMLGR